MKSSNRPNESTKTFLNRKLPHDFFIGKKFEAGLVLSGSEVKSLRVGNCTLDGAFVHVGKNGPVIINLHIDEYKYNTLVKTESTRTRFLLLNSKEIKYISDEINKKGVSVVPVKLYFKKGLAKIEIAICKAKKLYDKRADLKKQIVNREIERRFKTYRN